MDSVLKWFELYKPSDGDHAKFSTYSSEKAEFLKTMWNRDFCAFESLICPYWLDTMYWTHLLSRFRYLRSKAILFLAFKFWHANWKTHYFHKIPVTAKIYRLRLHWFLKSIIFHMSSYNFFLLMIFYSVNIICFIIQNYICQT